MWWMAASTWTCSQCLELTSQRMPSACPFHPNLFERVECDAVPEHVRNPYTVMQEIHRVVAPGGYVHLVTRFAIHFTSIREIFDDSLSMVSKTSAAPWKLLPKDGAPARRQHCLSY